MFWPLLKFLVSLKMFFAAVRAVKATGLILYNKVVSG